MTYDEDTDEYTLASGRKVYAYSGVLGLCPVDAEDESQVSYGADGGFDVVDIEEPWTTAERRELAEAMIARWTRWRDATS